MSTILVTGGKGFIGANLCRRLVAQGDKVVCVDNLLTSFVHNIEEMAAENMAKVIPDIEYCKTAKEAANGCDCLLIMTEWEEFKQINIPEVKNLLRQPNIIDGRNIFDQEESQRLEINYISVGR